MARRIEKLSDRVPKLKAMETRNFPVVKSNYLIQKTRYDLSLQEQKLVLHLIQMIEPNDEEFKKYRFSVQEYCDVCGIDRNNGGNYIKIKKSLKSLRDKSFWMELEDESEVLMSWVSKVRVYPSKGVIDVELDSDLKPYLLQLKAFFTKYNYLYVMTMRSQYSIRLYELLKSYENIGASGIAFEVDELRKTLAIPDDTLARWVDFKRFVIEQAVKEINHLTDITVRYNPIKKGRSVFEVQFNIFPKSEKAKILAQNMIERRLNPEKAKEYDETPY
jgi:plasmid replication initiation protein